MTAICRRLSTVFAAYNSTDYLVDSVYSSVVNLAASDAYCSIYRGDAGGQLRAQFLVPFAAQLSDGADAADFFAQLSSGAATSARWSACRRYVELAGGHRGSARRYAWTDDSTLLWDPLLPPLADHHHHCSTARLLAPACRDLLNRPLAELWPAASRPSDLLARALLARCDDVTRCVRSRSHHSDAALRRCLSALVGLGHGLTPSGDDVLVGVAATLRRVGHPLSAAAADCCRQAAAGASKTTRVSRAFLLSAAHGHYSEFVHRLVAALLLPAATPLDSAARIADFCAQFGHSSGVDTLAGALSVLRGFSSEST